MLLGALAALGPGCDRWASGDGAAGERKPVAKVARDKQGQPDLKVQPDPTPEVPPEPEPVPEPKPNASASLASVQVIQDCDALGISREGPLPAQDPPAPGAKPAESPPMPPARGARARPSDGVGGGFSMRQPCSQSTMQLAFAIAGTAPPAIVITKAVQSRAAARDRDLG